MPNEKQTRFWIIDSATFNELQILKTFLHFVAHTKYATESDKRDADKICYLIENLDNTDSFKNWNIALDIYNRDLMHSGNKEQGVYWRTWSVSFENAHLEIEAKTRHTAEPLHHYGNDFEYYENIHFRKKITGTPIHINGDLKEFVADAMNYNSYITDSLKDIEIDVYVE